MSHRSSHATSHSHRDSSKNKSGSQSRNQNSTNNEGWAGQFTEQFEDITSNVQERGKKFAQQIQSRVENSPWLFIGGTALAGLALGFIAGRRLSADTTYSTEY